MSSPSAAPWGAGLFGGAAQRSSFSDYLREAAPELLPANRVGASVLPADFAPHGTTIVALTFDKGVLIAGDRRATQGNLISSSAMQKVFVTDDFSAAGIAGTAGLAVELIRLFAVELEHYEKIEGVSLTFEGKANRLAGMVRGNLGAAMQGLAAVPLLVGYELLEPDPAKAGRIVSYDVTGHRITEAAYACVGSGSVFARSSLKKLHDPAADSAAAARTAIEALFDAAEDDSATGGPDLIRNRFPTIVTVTRESGAVFVPDSQVAAIAREVVGSREVPS